MSNDPVPNYSIAFLRGDGRMTPAELAAIRDLSHLVAFSSSAPFAYERALLAKHVDALLSELAAAESRAVHAEAVVEAQRQMIAAYFGQGSTDDQWNAYDRSCEALAAYDAEEPLAPCFHPERYCKECDPALTDAGQEGKP